MNYNSGIYQIRNLRQGKIYLGSSFDLKIREKAHFRLLKEQRHPNIHLQRAYNQDGKKSFTFEVLELVPRLENESKKDFRKRLVYGREQFYLDTLLFAQEKDNTFHELSYNISRKAHSRLGVSQKVRSHKKIMEGIETKRRNGTLKHTKAARRNMVKGHKSQRCAVVQLSLDGKKIAEFASITIAANKIKCGIHAIHIACKKNNKCTAGNYRWVYKDDYKSGNYSKVFYTRKKAVVQFDEKGNKIAEFVSVIEAGQQTKITNIRGVVRGVAKTAGGFYWQLKIEDDKRYLENKKAA